MSNDSRFVLAQLTRTGIWSRCCNLLQYNHLVLEADSVITHLYQHCVNRRLQNQKSISGGKSKAAIDYHSATLINYKELALLFEQLLDYFDHFSVRLIIVYRGKHMEAPLFGLGPAQFKKNTQRTLECLLAMIELEKCLAGEGQPRREYKATLDRMRPLRPNLALNLFKQVLNRRVREAAAAKRSPAPIECHQAFYCPYPACARLARDFKCPVMTNDGDFVVMDVRAGFIMFEDFFVSHLMSSSSSRSVSGRSRSASSPIAPMTSQSSSSSMSRYQLSVGPQGRAKSPKSPELPDSRPQDRHKSSQSTVSPRQKSRPHRPTASPVLPNQQVMLRVNFHRFFLIQHPGLNHALALQLFPLTSGEFLTHYAKSLVRLRIYDREYSEKDLIMATADQKSFKKYHMAAARLEHVLRFLCAKDSDVVPNLVRGEAIRLSSAIERDYQEMYNYYAVSYHFKRRLRLILRQKTVLDDGQLECVERLLLERECSADFWLSLMCCALGQLSSVDYNKSMQFEDLQTKHSARSMLDRPKSVMMGLLSGDNKLQRSVRSPSIKEDQKKQLDARFSTASLTVIDREGSKLLERVVAGQLTKAGASQLGQQQITQFETLRARLTLNNIIKPAKTGSAASDSLKNDAAALMKLAFNSSDLSSISVLKHTSGTVRHLAESLKQDRSREAQQVVIMINLHRFTLDQAMRDDQYFKQNYLPLGPHFEAALVNCHLFQRLSKSSPFETGIGHDKKGSGKTSPVASAANELRSLSDAIHRHDMENVTDLRAILKATRSARDEAAMRTNSATSPKVGKVSAASSAKSISKGKSSIAEGDLGSTTKLIRHLIELLGGAIEAYCELNAFLDYPTPQLHLEDYNPILLFNLTLRDFLLEAASQESKLESKAESAPAPDQRQDQQQAKTLKSSASLSSVKKKKKRKEALGRQ